MATNVGLIILVALEISTGGIFNVSNTILENNQTVSFNLNNLKLSLKAEPLIKTTTPTVSNSYYNSSSAKRFIGEWSRTSSENVEEVLEVLEIPYEIYNRTSFQQLSKYLIAYNENKNEWRFSSLNIQIGKEYDLDLGNGQPGKALMVFNDDKFIYTEKYPNGTIILTEIAELVNENECLLSIQVGTVVAKHRLQRIMKPEYQLKSFIGKWNLTSSENFEEFLEAVGVGWMLRKAAIAQKPKSIITFNEDKNEWTFVVSTPFRTLTTTFEIGKEFKEILPSGDPCKSIFTIEQGKFIQTQRDLKGNIVTIQTRELTSEDEYMLTLDAGTVVAKRGYRRIKA